MCWLQAITPPTPPSQGWEPSSLCISRVVASILLTALLAIAGCHGDNRLGADDPLFNGGNPLATTPVASTTPPPKPAPLPPHLAPSSATSTAALAQGARAGGAPPAATLRQPEPMAPTASHREDMLAGRRPSSYDQAQALLAARGVKWQRLETWGDAGNWKFSCSIPTRQNPFISRTYEGQSPSYLGAVQAVLDQIDRDEQQ